MAMFWQFFCEEFDLDETIGNAIMLRTLWWGI